MVTDRRTNLNGPLASHEASFADELSRLGYKRGPAGRHLRLLADLDDWLAGEGLAPGELTSDRVGEFLRSRRARGHRELVTILGFGPVFEHLVHIGVVPELARPVPTSEFADSLERYREYLANERGLSEGVIERYVRCAGINRHEERDENARHRRCSEPRWPRVMERRDKPALRWE